MENIRVGIDVGGTFTHAVAIDSESNELIAKSKVLTTHTAEFGVAEGIIQSLNNLLNEPGIDPKKINFIAHSTTQATNALLEGDVAKVGIIGMGKGFEGKRAKSETDLGKIELTSGKFLPYIHTFIDSTNNLSDQEISNILDVLINEGAQVIVASEAFATDEPINEKKILEACLNRGILSVAASEISQLYGLRIRTRTAAINGSILPKMIEAASKTEEAIKKAGINVPLMVMRSDGGVISLEEVKKKPILTLLSGPAAGVAAALMYVKISEGIFVEVGGTSTDISVIHHGKAQIKTAQIGNHRTYLQTLDVRTLGVAGGSMPRINLKEKKILDLGPRSAHIANLPYLSFTPDLSNNIEAENHPPKKGDPEDYLSFTANNKSYALTTTCLSNFLGFIKKSDYSYSENSLIKYAVEKISQILNSDPKTTAKDILKLGINKLNQTIWNLIKEYKLNDSLINIIGGGGGASTLVPLIRRTKNEENLIEATNYHYITNHAEVISAIGVAMALMREVIRKSIINPSQEDIKNLRQEAYNMLLRNGAKEETIEVNISIDQQKNIIEAEAVGSRELREHQTATNLSEDDQKEIIKKYLLNTNAEIGLIGKTGYFNIWQVKSKKSSLLGFLKTIKNYIVALDSNGLIKFSIENGTGILLNKSVIVSDTKDILEKEAKWGDAGVLYPKSYIFIGGRILDLSKLYTLDQIKGYLDLELSIYNNNEKAVLVIEKKK